MTLEDLVADHNWMQVFGEEEADNNCNAEVEGIGGCSDTPKPTRADVVEILALEDTSDAEWDGWLGTGVFLLRDGRYLYARGGCDYTGWD